MPKANADRLKAFRRWSAWRNTTIIKLAQSTLSQSSKLEGRSFLSKLRCNGCAVELWALAYDNVLRVHGDKSAQDFIGSGSFVSTIFSTLLGIPGFSGYVPWERGNLLVYLVV